MVSIRVILLLAVFFVQGAFGQSPFIWHYSEAHGLPSNLVYWATQDSKGYIWLATDEGVSRFNGRTFTNFSVSDGLSDNEIFQIHEDGQGRLWFLTYSGIPCFYKAGKFYNPDNTPFLAEIPATGFLSCFVEGPDGSIYLGNSIGQVYRIYNDETVERVIDVFSDEGYVRFIFSHKNQVHALIENTSIRNLASGKETELEKTYPCPPAQHHLYANDQLFTTNRNRVVFFANEFAESHEVVLDEHEFIFGISYGFEERYISFCTRNGLCFFDLETKRLSKRYLSDEQILSTFLDARGGLWVCTMDNGVYYAPFSDMVNYAYEDESICSLVNLNGRVYFGGENYQYGFIDEDSLRRFVLEGIDVGGRGRVEDFFFVDPYFILRIEKNIFLSKKFQGPYELFNHASITVCPASSGNLWVGGITGIMLMDPERLDESGPILLHKLRQRVFCLIDMGDSSLLAGSSTGVLRVSLKDGSAKEVYPETQQKRISALYQLDDGKVMVSTEGWGVYIYQNEELLAHFNVDNGLIFSDISKILADNDEGLWLCGSRGISYLKNKQEPIESWEWHSVDFSNGLPVNKVEDAAILGDKLYVASSIGITAIEIPSFFGPEEPPRMSVRQFRHANSSEHLLYNGELLQIPGDWKTFVVEYDGISFPAQKLRYRFQLDGGKWKETPSDHIDLANLNAGRHLLKLSAKSDFSEWSPPTALKFEVEVEFWESWWFKLLEFLAAAALLFLLVRLKVVLVDQKVLLGHLRKIVERASGRNTINLKVGAESRKVSIASILWIKSEGNYCSVVTAKRKMLVYATLKSFEESLETEKQFVRVHRSFIVNLEQITAVKRNQLSIAETVIPIGETYLLNFRTAYGSYKA